MNLCKTYILLLAQLWYQWHEWNISNSNVWPREKQQCCVCLYFLFGWVCPGRSCFNKNAIVVGLSKLQFINFSSFKAFLIISRVNIWSTKGLSYFRKRAYVNLPSCHRQSDSHHNTAHERRASFCIHRTCLCHGGFELPLGHLSQCAAIHFIFITPGCFTPLAPPPAPPLQTPCYP